MNDGASAGATRGSPRPDVVGRVLDGIDRVCAWGGWASAVCIVAILVLIAGEVAARNFFNYSLDFAWEFSAFLMGAAFMMGAGYSLRVGAQIRVRVLLDNVPPGSRRVIDLLATLFCLVVAAYLTCALAQLTWLSWIRDSRSDKSSELPLWIAQAPLALGAALLALQSLARFCRVLRGEPGEDLSQRVGQDAEAEAS